MRTAGDGRGGHWVWYWGCDGFRLGRRQGGVCVAEQGSLGWLLPLKGGRRTFVRQRHQLRQEIPCGRFLQRRRVASSGAVPVRHEHRRRPP